MPIDFKVKAEFETGVWSVSIKELNVTAEHENIQEALTDLAGQAIEKIKEEFQTSRRIEIAFNDIKATAVLGVRAYDDHSLSDFEGASEEPETQAMLPGGDGVSEETWISGSSPELDEAEES